MPCSAFRVAIWKCFKLPGARWELLPRDPAVNVSYVSTCDAAELAVVWFWASELLLLALVRLSGGPWGKIFELDAPCLSCKILLVGADPARGRDIGPGDIAVAALRLPQMEGARPFVPL